MARLLTSGFEWKDTTATAADGFLDASATIETSIVRSGAASLKCVSQALGATFTVAAVTLGNDCFLRAYAYIPSATPALAGNPMMSIQSGNAIWLNTDGTLQLQTGATVQGSPSVVVNLDDWNRIELRLRIGVGSVDQVEGVLNGVSFASATGLNLGDTQITSATAVSPGGTVYFDDVAINDSAGASQNTWPGSGKVVLLVPASDNAKGTGWTNDAAGASNFFDAVNNTPPAGIADTTGGSGLHQIRNATSNANSNYDANLTTYSAAGIAAADTINVLVPEVATAAPVTTSSKQGTYGISSNPAITNVALGAGGTSGAFWSGTAAGTYSTGWKWSFGTITYAPTVTVGNAPVARITQVTSSTRIAMVCAMGMYVDYTPAATVLPRLPFNVDFAVARSTNY